MLVPWKKSCDKAVVVQSLSRVSLWPYGLRHTRLLCPSPSPRVCSNSCPLSQLCHPAISSSVVPFSYCPQSFPASEFFSISQLFTSGGQSIEASASASVLPMNIQGWFPLGLTVLIPLLFKGLSRVFSLTIIWKHQFFSAQPSSWSNFHIHTWYWKNHCLTCTNLSQPFKALSRFVLAFLPRSKHLLIWQSRGHFNWTDSYILRPGIATYSQGDERQAPGENETSPLSNLALLSSRCLC